MSRSEAKQLGDFIDPGQAGLVIVGESKVEDAMKHAVTRAEKQTAKDLGVSPKDVDKALQEAVREM
jgi:flavin-binding protein dodecin